MSPKTISLEPHNFTNYESGAKKGREGPNSTGGKRQDWTTAQNTSPPCPSLCQVNNAFKVDSREGSLSAGSQEETQLALDGTYEDFNERTTYRSVTVLQELTRAVEASRQQQQMVSHY